ncbi:MAG: TlpA family protein disulfide reductase [Candidatus Thermoplasmatota archaeon]|nr:TlpA family protein disulfide reductase [Candidatus Thermoplasmatota archaeon]
MIRDMLTGGAFPLSFLASFATAAAGTDVTLNDVHGKPHPFSEYIGRGQWTVLTVWGPRCPPCIEEMPELQKFHDANKDGKARVLGVAVDFPSFGPARRDEVAQFAGNYLIGFPLLLGSEDAFTRFGGADLLGVPTTVIYDPRGAIAARHTGSVSRDMLERFINKWDKPEASK